MAKLRAIIARDVLSPAICSEPIKHGALGAGCLGAARSRRRRRLAGASRGGTSASRFSLASVCGAGPIAVPLQKKTPLKTADKLGLSIWGVWDECEV